MIGTAGWERSDWVAGYYPDDLPEDWRLAYYANDCGCVLIDGADLARLQPGALEEALDDAGDHLVVLLRLEDDAAGLDGRWVELFSRLDEGLIVLAPPGISLDRRFNPWFRGGEGVWREPDGERCVVCWDIADFDLRQLKARASDLPGDVAALVIEGRGATPARVEELKTLLTLMGRA